MRNVDVENLKRVGRSCKTLRQAARLLDEIAKTTKRLKVGGGIASVLGK